MGRARRFLPEIVGTAVLLALGAAALLLLVNADSAVHIVLAVLCLIGMKVDIWVYKRVVRQRSIDTDVAMAAVDMPGMLD
jgi:hypothetical protein